MKYEVRAYKKSKVPGMIEFDFSYQLFRTDSQDEAIATCIEFGASCYQVDAARVYRNKPNVLIYRYLKGSQVFPEVAE